MLGASRATFVRIWLGYCSRMLALHASKNSNCSCSGMRAGKEGEGFDCGSKTSSLLCLVAPCAGDLLMFSGVSTGSFWEALLARPRRGASTGESSSLLDSGINKLSGSSIWWKQWGGSAD